MSVYISLVCSYDICTCKSVIIVVKLALGLQERTQTKKELVHVFPLTYSSFFMHVDLCPIFSLFLLMIMSISQNPGLSRLKALFFTKKRERRHEQLTQQNIFSSTLVSSQSTKNVCFSFKVILFSKTLISTT